MKLGYGIVEAIQHRPTLKQVPLSPTMFSNLAHLRVAALTRWRLGRMLVHHIFKSGKVHLRCYRPMNLVTVFTLGFSEELCLKTCNIFCVLQGNGSEWAIKIYFLLTLSLFEPSQWGNCKQESTIKIQCIISNFLADCQIHGFEG